MKKLAQWFDQHSLGLLAGILLVFIPLYPKLPLFDAIPGYIVRVRLEDFLILITAIVFLIQWRRKKVTIHPLVSKAILAYVVIGFLSVVSAIFITKTVPLSALHIAKIALHFVRRIEYFSLFFIFFASIKSIKLAKTYVISLLAVLSIASVYGFGQKFLYWPVYSTMNREFAKGWRLYLTEHARVPSTFGGHYDAAAFAMMIITIALSVALFTKHKLLKIASFISFGLGYYLLILTASRTSFLAFLAAMHILLFGYWLLSKNLIKTLVYWGIVGVFTLILALYSSDFIDRFEQVPGVKNLISFRENFHPKFGLYNPGIDTPQHYLSVSELSMVTSVTDEPPSPVDPRTQADNNLPPDVYENIPLPVAVVDEQGNETGEYELQDRTYSDAAHTYGLSAAIRYDTLWPRALAGLKSNPLLGSGYSTLTKEEVGQFTEAESTDNEFLRSLGETGILGFVSFFGVVLAVMVISLKGAFASKDLLIRAYLAGFVAASIGLLINAAYIDVFTASKVAETYWAMAGIAVAVSVLALQSKKSLK